MKPRPRRRFVLTAFAFACALAACGPGTRNVDRRPDAGASSLSVAAADSLVELLLTAAATDFHRHRPPDPVAFRDVELVQAPRSDGAAIYMLCGEFEAERPDGRLDWIPFATIRTDPYEHWVGDSALGYCGSAGHVEHGVDDLAEALQRRMEAVRAAT